MYVHDSPDPYKAILKSGPLSMTDEDLVRVMLGKGASNDAVAQALGCYYGRSQMDMPDLTPARKSQVQASLELARRCFGNRIRVSSPKDIFQSFAHYDGNVERFLVAILNGAHEILSVEMVSQGLVNRTVVHPREVFAPAIEKRAVAIIVAHNHPSGRLDPSLEDLEITKRLVEAGKTIGINVLDHLVFTKDSYYSMTEHGIIDMTEEG